MCGFVGIFDLSGSADLRSVRRMTEAIRHRGPDDEDYFESDWAAFGFRRLAILDLSESARQPMLSPDKSLVLVFNGEIFNYVELRQELESLGHRFRSSGDTEVLLHSYMQWGERCLPKLNGMFAFLIFDRKEKKLFGARDRFGIKPLFLTRSGDSWLFGSEIKALLASGLCEKAVNWEVAADFLLRSRLFRWQGDGQTFLKGIESLDRASGFELGLDGNFRTWKYWSLPADRSGHSPQEVAPRWAELFEDSVRLRMRSDVPVGVCLSGGLDSTSIVCSMARQRAGPEPHTASALNAFCYQAPEFDERRFIQETLNQTGASLNNATSDGRELWEILPGFLWQQDEPVHSTSALIGYVLMRLAADRSTPVVLNGQGADEVLGGYGSYFAARWHSLIGQFRLRRAWAEISHFVESHGGSSRSLFTKGIEKSFRAKLRAFRPYRRASLRRELRQLETNPWFDSELSRHLAEMVPPDAKQDLDSVLGFSIEVDPLPLYLRIEDRNSMAHSVEARLPFLDYRLVEYSHRLSEDWKIRGHWNKYVLREAMRCRIPESVRSRVDKMGFPTQHREWFAGPWYEPMQDLLASRQAAESGLYRLKRLRSDLDRHRRGEVSLSEPLLFNVAQFEIWRREVLGP